jgi:hypothetical protein
MDTLDKKMQTILERDDLSADERLKLYDQWFTNIVEHLLLVWFLRIFPSLWIEIFPFVQHVVDYIHHVASLNGFSLVFQFLCLVPANVETALETIREANVPQYLIAHENRWRYITQTKTTPRSRKRQQSPPLLDRTPQNTKKQKERSPELGRLVNSIDYNASPGKSSSSWFMQSVRVL